MLSRVVLVLCRIALVSSRVLLVLCRDVHVLCRVVSCRLSPVVTRVVFYTRSFCQHLHNCF